MALIDLSFIRLKLSELVARTIEVKETLDVSDAEVVGLDDLISAGVIGSYSDPAVQETVTLTSGLDPAGVVSWGDQPARLALDTQLNDPDGVIDPDQDIEFWAVEDPDDPDLRQFEFVWQNDPEQDVQLEVTISKII